MTVVNFFLIFKCDAHRASLQKTKRAEVFFRAFANKQG
jgi:hypothetical protein